MSFCFNSLRSSTLFNQIILDSLEREGFDDLTPALLGIFAFLAEAKPMSISALAEGLGNSRQAMHKNIGKLAASGYITLQTRPHNRKEKLVVLTERGELLVGRSLQVIARTEERMADFLGAQAFETYLGNQRKLLEFLKETAGETQEQGGNA